MLIILILLWPFIEIWGFVAIGAHIGAGLSILWVFASAFYGVRLLAARRAPATPFDELCRVLAALLLIFPGFISDFVALPLLWGPTRRILAALIWQRHQQALNDLDRRLWRFTYWQRENRPTETRSDTIEGDFKRIDSDDKKIT